MHEKEEKGPGPDEALKEYVRLYYEHQYERLAKLDDQRLSITNLVMPLSAGALAFGFSSLDGLTLINGVGLPLMVVFSNLFAIGYIMRTRDFMRVHKRRARYILEKHASEIAEVNGIVRWSSVPFYRERTTLQVGLHSLLMLTATLPSWVYMNSLLS